MEIRKPKGKNGGKRPGSGRKKGTPNFTTRELKEIARKEAPVLYVLKGATGYKAEQGPHYAPGISAETVGSSALWFGLVSPSTRSAHEGAHPRKARDSVLLSGRRGGGAVDW